ncbi:cucumisin-like [Quercus lobata]|uniref:Cucumisin n=1 Tax=Quercus lobata TaxID=97700 RepID=A0A7N2N385_QUELO|nr:cucumisin-like [Quercus lobata]
MATAVLHILLHTLLLAALLLSCHGQERKVHIVYMGDKIQGDFSAASSHHSMLESVLGSASTAKESLLYSYGKSFNGFAAKLTDEEVEKFSEMEGVISVLPNHRLNLHTTRSWDFMGFPSKGKVGSPQEGDVIIGLLDTGIWPESDSFNDEGLGSPPSKWKGKCQGANFTCNNKIIGARYYNSEGDYDIIDIKSPRNSEDHGTHTSSTAAGREVAGASYFGLAEGTARGGVPGARTAMYKVCWSSGCYSADVLAAFDDAIADGVDIISVSIGFGGFSPYFEDPLAIGSFHAMKNGILTSASAGNSGPFPLSIANHAPWILTVAASTIDRKFVAQVVLGSGQAFTGLSINSFNLNGTSFPLISVEDGLKILNYIRSTKFPIATILVGETWKDVMAPYVVSFSSRGPNPIAPDILKPDLTAPGVDILAAWSPVAPPSVDQDDTRSVKFNIISGTSMSCPHTSGAANYVKAAHPNWSPAAIKSALMTTVYIVDPKKHEDLEFAYGSGHINPLQAVDPGLVYDAYEADYINFLCMQGYNTTTLRLVNGDKSSFCNTSKPGRAWNLRIVDL